MMLLIISTCLPYIFLYEKEPEIEASKNIRMPDKLTDTNRTTANDTNDKRKISRKENMNFNFSTNQKRREEKVIGKAISGSETNYLYQRAVFRYRVGNILTPSSSCTFFPNRTDSKTTHSIQSFQETKYFEFTLTSYEKQIPSSRSISK